MYGYGYGYGLGASGRQNPLAPPPGTPSGASAFLDFANQRYFVGGRRYGEPFIPGRSFTRSGARAAGRADGSQIIFPTGVPRITDLGLRVTAGATNLLAYSQDIANAYFTKLEATIGAASGDDPETIIPSAVSTATHGIERVFSITNGTQYSWSWTLGENGYRYVMVQANATGGGYVLFDLQDGTIVAEVGATGAISAAGSLYRCSITFTAAETNSRQMRVRVFEDAALSAFSGDGTSGIFATDGQFEVGSPTDYIPTEASAASAGADEYTLTDLDALGLTSAVLAAGYTVVVDAVRSLGSAVNASNSSLLSIRDGVSVVERTLLYNPSGREGVLIQKGGVTQVLFDSGVTTAAGSDVRMALRVSTDDFGLAVNGGTVQTDTSGEHQDYASAALHIGAGGPATSVLNGFIRSIAIIPTPVDDATLQALSGS